MSDLHTNYQQLIEEFVAEHDLPADYGEDARKWFQPLTEELLEVLKLRNGKPLLLGINGSQGSGKSTLSALMQTLLASSGISTAVLSIDDFYLDGKERARLASEIHPLLRSRGVPGTHDVTLALDTIARLKSPDHKEEVLLPRFNKASDEPMPSASWPTVSNTPQLIILEGWFVGAQPQQQEDLAEPVNQLEAERDADGIWRQYVNEQLAGQYQRLFAQLDHLIMLKAPDFQQVYQWRQKQENKLAARSPSDENNSGLMNESQLREFIQHFERLTAHCLNTLPALADRVYFLDSEHRVSSTHTK